MERYRMGRRHDFIFGAVDDESGRVIVVVAESVEGVDCVEVRLVWCCGFV